MNRHLVSFIYLVYDILSACIHIFQLKCSSSFSLCHPRTASPPPSYWWTFLDSSCRNASKCVSWQSTCKHRIHVIMSPTQQEENIKFQWFHSGYVAGRKVCIYIDDDAPQDPKHEVSSTGTSDLHLSFSR